MSYKLTDCLVGWLFVAKHDISNYQNVINLMFYVLFTIKSV